MPNIFPRLSLLLQLLHSFLLFLLPTTTTTTTTTTTKPPDEHNQIKKPPTNNSNKMTKTPSHLHGIFDTFDADKDGLITRHELSISLHKMGIPITDSDLAALIKTVDVNDDGCVDVSEFEALYAILTSTEEEGGHDLKDAFGVFDKDGDGFISEEELKGVLESMGLCHGRRSLEECRRMIQRVDVDGDGRVCFSEFQLMMKDAGFAFPPT